MKLNIFKENIIDKIEEIYRNIVKIDNFGNQQWQNRKQNVSLLIDQGHRKISDNLERFDEKYV